MNALPLLESIWPGLGTPVLTVQGTSVTVGGAAILTFWTIAGGVLGRFLAKRLVRFESERGLLDPQVHTFSRMLIAVIMLPPCILIGLDMGGMVSVTTSSWELWRVVTGVLGWTLFTRQDVQVTLGGLLSLGFWGWVGRKLSQKGSELAARLSGERGLEDERIVQLIRQLVQGTLFLICIAIGLDMGRLSSIQNSVSTFFSIFTSPMFMIGDHAITITTLATLAAIVAGSFYVSRIARASMRPALMLRIDQPGTLSVVDRLTHYMIVAIGMIVALQTAGIDLSALLAAGAAFAVGLSLAMQSMAQNFISGLILLIERVIKPGDILKLDGEPVRVVRIGIRSTVVKTLNDEDCIVPNSTLVENAITNYSYSNQNIRIRAAVGVAYESDLRVAMKALEGAAASVKRATDREPTINLTGFGASSVDFEVSIWIQDPWVLHQAASELRLAIWDALQDAQVVIAYPQLDLHFDEESRTAMTVLSGGRGQG